MNIREDIKAYIDGELSAERAEQVRSAIESDPALREEYEFMKGLSRQMQSSVKDAQVQGYEKAKASVSGGRRWRFRWVGGLVAAAAVTIFGAVVWPVFSQAMSAADGKLFIMGGQGGESAGDVPSSETFDDGLDFTMGAPGSNYGNRAESAGDGRDSDNLFGPSMGVSDGVTFGEGSVGSGGGALRRLAPSGGWVAPSYDTAMKATPQRRDSEANVPVQTLTPVQVGEARLVIKDASISLLVEDVKEAMDEATLLVKAAKGYIESSSLDDGEKKANGYMTLRVPEKEFEGLVSTIRSFGDLKSDQLGGDDVTGTVADIDARIKTLTAEEDSYRVLLRNAKKIGDILDIKDRISQVRLQIESYDARRRTLSRLAVLATITVRFSSEKEVVAEPVIEEPDTWFEDTKIASVSVLKGIGKFVAQVGTFLFILIPVWVPMLLGALWFRGRALRSVDAS